MNKYNEHVKESIDYFNHESECMKHRVCNCDMQTSLRRLPRGVRSTCEA